MTDQLDTSPRTGTDVADQACCTGATAQMTADDAESLAAQLGAIADPVRLQVLSIIAGAPDGEVCACDFVGPIQKSQPTISHHLKVLSEAGLVDGEKRGRWVWYRLAPTGLSAVLDAVASVTGAEPGREAQRVDGGR